MIVAVLFTLGQFYASPARKVDLLIEQCLPQDVLGWTVTEKDQFFSATNLHEYIDGASEIYKALNVRRVVARRYAKPGFPEITVDIFTMHTPADAFGAYHHDIRDGEDPHIGRESEFQGATLAFWKDRQVVYVTAPSATEPVRAAILAIGKSLDDAIRPNPDPPDLLNMLPKLDGGQSATRYFHNHLLLNLYNYVSDENLLNLSSKTEGILARYKTPEGLPVTCLIVRYTSLAGARKACASFMNGYLHDAAPGGVAKTENGRWTGARRADKLLCVVFDAPDKTAATRLLDQIAGQGGTSK